jgi:hypothetical protein
MFTQDTLATVGAQASNPPTGYSYRSADNLATVTGDGYFAAKQSQFIEGDWILALLSDGHAMLEVLADTSKVSVINIAVSSEPVVQRFSTGGTIEENTNVALSTGTHTLIMPTSAESILQVKSISGVVTLDSGTNTVESGNTVSSTVNRIFYLDGTVWIEL